MVVARGTSTPQVGIGAAESSVCYVWPDPELVGHDVVLFTTAPPLWRNESRVTNTPNQISLPQEDEAFICRAFSPPCHFDVFSFGRPVLFTPNLRDGFALSWVALADSCASSVVSRSRLPRKWMVGDSRG